MKRTMLILFLSAIATPVMAGEVSGNPDRFPSIGLNFHRTTLDGTLTATASPISAKQDTETTLGVFVIDGRLPINPHLTFNASLGFINDEATATETALLTGQNVDSDGLAFNIGLRFYIH